MSAASPEPVGYAALDSLRIEKGYRYFGADLTSSDTPFEAGLGFCVARDKRTELDRAPAQRLRTLVVGADDHYLTIYGGEAVRWNDGAVIGRLRSAAYGFTVRRNIALAMLPSELEEGTEVQVDVFGELVSARVAPDALYDPAHERVRG
jgi:4-methylaminobutanoate oxidase (formaldehyde-forming)